MIDELKNAINTMNKSLWRGEPCVMFANSEKHRQFLHKGTGYPLELIKVVAKLPLDGGDDRP